MEAKMGIKTNIEYWPNGNKRREEWYFNNDRHREDGPAFIDYHESGTVIREIWFINEQLHKPDSPAYIWYNKSGKIEREYWFVTDEDIVGEVLIKYKKWLIANNLYKPYNTWTDEEKVLWKLSWL